MRKIELIIALVLALIVGLSVPFQRIAELKSEQQGLMEHFQLLKKLIETQKQAITDVNHDIKFYLDLYRINKPDVERYGVGGSVSIDQASLLPVSFQQIIHENDIALKSATAYLRVVQDKLEATAVLVEHLKDSLRHTPSLRPVPLDSIRSISSFGLRKHPILHIWKLHEGIDYGCEVGTPVYATADGIVVVSGYDPVTGQYVKINHGYGYVTLYGHLSRRLVRAGQVVHKGDLIGYTGNTGRSVGPHLHYEVRYHGQHINPALFIPEPIEPEIESLHSRRSHSYFLAR